VVCSYVRETGSHFKKRTCKTVAQIEAEREQALREHGGALLGVCPIQRNNAMLPGHDLIFCDTSPIEFQPLRLFKLDRPTIMGSV
jgi:hypothetical protein